MLQVLQNVTQNSTNNLEEIANIFDRLNCAYRSYLMVNVQSQLGLPVVSSETHSNEVETSPKVIIEQSDMYTNVLSILADHMNTNDSTSKL